MNPGFQAKLHSTTFAGVGVKWCEKLSTEKQIFSQIHAGFLDFYDKWKTNASMFTSKWDWKTATTSKSLISSVFLGIFLIPTNLHTKNLITTGFGQFNQPQVIQNFTKKFRSPDLQGQPISSHFSRQTPS